MSPVICLGPVLFRACACTASSQVTWPGTARRPGAPPVLMYLFLCRLPVLLFPFPFPLSLQCRLLLYFVYRSSSVRSFRYRSCFSFSCYRCVYTYSIRASCFNVPCACVIRLVEKSPMGRATPLRLLRPVLLLSSLLLILYRHPSPPHLCLAVLPLPGMKMSPCLRLVHPLPGQPSLLVPHVPHLLITKDLSVWLCLKSSSVRMHLPSKSNVSPW